MVLGIEIKTANAFRLPVCFFLPFFGLVPCRSKERFLFFGQEKRKSTEICAKTPDRMRILSGKEESRQLTPAPTAN